MTVVFIYWAHFWYIFVVPSYLHAILASHTERHVSQSPDFYYSGDLIGLLVEESRVISRVFFSTLNLGPLNLFLA